MLSLDIDLYVAHPDDVGALRDVAKASWEHDHARSKRSSFITLLQVSTKSSTNVSSPSSAA